MDSPQSKPSLVDRLVSGIKEKTVQLAESQLQKNFQEEVPEEAVLGFIASAVFLGAQRFDVRVQGNDLVLAHDGKRMTESEASMLHRGVQSLPELSKAFRLHLGKDEGRIELQFLTETNMLVAQFKGFAVPSIAPADLADLKLANLTTRIVLKGSGNYRRVNQAMGNELPEISLIRKRCFLAPLDIIVSGRPIDRYTRLPESLVTGTNFGQDHHATLSTLPTLASQGYCVDLTALKPHIQAVRAGICGVARSAGDAGWYFLHSGVARPINNVSWLSRTWGFVHLSDTPDLARLEKEIIFITKALVGQLFECVQERTSDRAEESLTFLEQNRGILTEAGHSPVEQDRVFLKLREQLSPSSDPRVLNNRLELASSLEAHGHTEESEKLYAEVLPVWESEALNHFDKYRFEEGAALWQRALSLREKLATDPNELCDKYVHLAEIGKEQRMGLAEQAYRRALQLVKTCGVENRQREYKILLGLAQVLKKNRVLTESLALAEQAQKVMLEISDGRETKELVPVLKLQAEIYDLNNDYARSTEFEQKAMLLKFKR